MRPSWRLFIAACLAVIDAATSSLDVAAHTVNMAAVQHDVSFRVDPKHIDVVVELTFHAIASLAERHNMDVDHDGAVSGEEAERYLDGMRDTILKRVQLSVDDKTVELFPLYDPQLELLDTERTEPVHHVLRLYCFSRTPDTFGPGSIIKVSDTLWPRAAAIRSCDGRGEHGVDLVADRHHRLAAGTCAFRCRRVPEGEATTLVGKLSAESRYSRIPVGSAWLIVTSFFLLIIRRYRGMQCSRPASDAGVVRRGCKLRN